MGKKKKNAALAAGANAGALLFAALVIVSFFLAYYTVSGFGVSASKSGWDYFGEGGSGTVRAYIVISVILSAAVAGIALLRLLRFPLFGGKLFSLLFACAAIALIVIAVLIMVEINGSIVGGIGIGAILNLIFSVFAAGCAVCTLVLKK
jgi:hypothetical protein